MSFNTILITGANRGIGLEFVRQLLALSPPPKHIIATARQTNTEELKTLATNNNTVHVLQLDARNYAKYNDFVAKVTQIVGDDGLDLLINNAGIAIIDGLSTVTPEKMIENFDVNSVAPLMLTKALLPLLETSAKARRTAVINISSQIGSIDDNTSGGYYPYRVSKAALNMISKSLAVDLRPKKIDVISLHPGWVQTDMGTMRAKLTPEESVAKMIKTLQTFDSADNGKMLRYDGSIIPF